MNSDRKNNEITELRDQYDKLIKKYNRYEEPFNKLGVDIAVLQERLKGTTDAKEQLQFEEKIKNLQTQREPLEKPEVRAEVARLNSSITALQTKIASLENSDPSSPSFRRGKGMSNKSEV
jgi:predicted  nucleic acid-binding Zn-ribbon protein